MSGDRKGLVFNYETYIGSQLTIIYYPGRRIYIREGKRGNILFESWSYLSLVDFNILHKLVREIPSTSAALDLLSPYISSIFSA